MSGVQLNAKVFPLAFLLYLFKPQISINGAPAVAGRWGQNDIPLQPGRYQVDCWFNYLFGPANRASIVVDVPAGGMVQLRYRTRWMVFLAGKLDVASAGGGAVATAAGPAFGSPAGVASASGAPTAASPFAPPASTPPPVAAAPAAGEPASWRPDPSGRHELRYWDGQRWTEHVSDRGAAGVDPLG